MILPAHVTSLRPVQSEVIEEIVAAFSSYKFVIVELPTGAGKSLIGELVRQRLNCTGIYLCVNHALEQQFHRDFPYARRIDGKANYKPTAGWVQKTSLTCEDCTWAVLKPPSCRLCREIKTCPYKVAKRDAVDSKLVVTNLQYYLGEARSAGKLTGRGLVVLDEADEAEGVLLGQVEIYLSADLLRNIRLTPPDPIRTRWPHRHAWLKDELIPALQQCISSLSPAREARKISNYARLLARVSMIVTTPITADEWVYRRNPNGSCVFKPIRVSQFGNMIWDTAGKFLIMSATIISPEQYAMEMGIPDGEWIAIARGSEFPVVRRPVYIVPAARVTHSTADTAYPAIRDKVKAIMSRHPTAYNILVHTVSRKMAAYLYDELGSSLVRSGGRVGIQYGNRGEAGIMGKDEALELFKNTPGAVLFAQSMERGVDLPGDLCRVQIIVKTPSPNLDDKQVEKRLRQPDGQAWYDVRIIRQLVQMTGRSTRSESDWSYSYILDSMFEQLYRKRSAWFPLWWREAIRTNNHDPLKEILENEAELYSGCRDNVQGA